MSEKENIPEDIMEAGEALDGYAVEVRYPDDWFEPTVADAQEAVKLAIKIRTFISTKLE